MHLNTANESAKQEGILSKDWNKREANKDMEAGTLP